MSLFAGFQLALQVHSSICSIDKVHALNAQLDTHLTSVRSASTSLVIEFVNCYDLPQYWDLAFDDDTKLEADFLEAAAKKYCEFEVKRVLEPGCGGGRLVLEMARRGFVPTGWDLSSEAVDYANKKLQAANLMGEAQVADMRSAIVAEQADLAYCLVNTFRHMLTETDAIQHLKSVAACLRPGAIYVVGMHLFPPDADEEDSEEWSVTADSTTVDMLLNVVDCDRDRRQETLQFHMTVREPGEEPRSFETDYRMRLYEAAQFQSLIDSVNEFELLPEVYDFWYDIEDPLELSDELGDTVFVLRRV